MDVSISLVADCKNMDIKIQFLHPSQKMVIDSISFKPSVNHKITKISHTVYQEFFRSGNCGENDAWMVC